MCENIQLIFAVFRMGVYSLFRRLCCGGPPPAKPSFTVIGLGMGGSGKSSLLATVSGEAADDIPPTVGFSIKALMFDNCFVDVKELGGGDNVRPYWNRYYSGAQGVIFVVDSSADDVSMEKCRNQFEDALDDPDLDGLPLLVLANFQDKANARKEQEIRDILELETLSRPWLIQACSLANRDSIMEGFKRFNKLLMSSQRGAGEFDKI
ncbi:ADP-ribosylation factor-like protein 15 [Dreissena polymorpha]|uniref:ADP-ribosylation factor-like protein 15 n=1 Tax=Dreissena polymorpha TaxID=45954 RepID=UPI0022644FA1|nr:ADP-ribosylation factor-like protein 15 [Dreissena polymorpha]